jgi:hypothetical protein
MFPCSRLQRRAEGHFCSLGSNKHILLLIRITYGYKVITCSNPTNPVICCGTCTSTLHVHGHVPFTGAYNQRILQRTAYCTRTVRNTLPEAAYSATLSKMAFENSNSLNTDEHLLALVNQA